MNSQISGLDWQILEALQEDGRSTVSQLSRQLNRSRNTISEHMTRLQDTGVLDQVSACVDVEKLGFGITAFIRLQASSTKHRDITDALLDLPEVAECHVLTGSDLVMLKVHARDMPHLRELVDGMTRFGSTETYIVFATLRDRVSVNPLLKRVAAGG
jgi:Lrp/AsnC family leucine-responsive transcriptional regulator